jgi:exosortase/archaeosortase family protein
LANYCGFYESRICNLQEVNFSKQHIFFLAKFLLIFLALYYGTYAFIGLSEKGGYYIAWLHYIDYVSYYRTFLLKSATHWLGVFGDYALVEGRFYLNMQGRLRIQLIYQCLGIGVNAFWIAFVLADVYSSIKRKIIWALGGFLLISILNIARIVLLAKALYYQWPLLAKMEHHTVYNYGVYAVVIIMVILYKKKTD